MFTLPKEVEFIINTLEQKGFQAFIVGGCVRDSLLNKQPNDFDITTNAKPEETINCFMGYTVVPTGLQHGTVTVVINTQSYEITTYRTETKYSDHRRPDKVEFTSSLEADLSRRDFTINAFAYSSRTGLIDKFGSMKDLENGIIRSIGSAEERFNEDALRIMRGVRFASQLNFTIESETKKAILNMKADLNYVSAERIQQELNKAITSEYFAKVFIEYSDILVQIIPEIKPTINFNQYSKYHDKDVYHHTLSAIDHAETQLEIKLAMLFHDIGKPETFSIDTEGNGHFYGHEAKGEKITLNVLSRLKYSNKIIKNVSSLVKWHRLELVDSIAGLKKQLGKHGIDFIKQLIAVQKADTKASSPEIIEQELKRINKTELLLEEILISHPCLFLSDLEVNGNDMIELGVVPGEQIGILLNQLLKMVLNEELDNRKEALLIAAKEIIGNSH